jgi:hypothetical protein
MIKGVQASYGVLQQRQEAILRKMARVGPFIMATPTRVKMRCGNSNCKCAKKKEDRHEQLHLSWTDAEGDGVVYVPVDLHKEVLGWVENYWTVKGYMKEMTEISRQMIKIYAKTLGAHKKRMAKKVKEEKI